MQLGFPELVIIMIIIVLIFGSDKLIQAVKSTGKVVKDFRKSAGNGALLQINELIGLTDLSFEDIQRDKEVSDLKALIGVLRLIKNRIMVFVSSTMEDLVNERRIVATAIEDILATRPWLFEDQGGPDKRTPEQVYLDAIKKSNIFILIVGENISKAVQKEYEVATINKKPILVFVKRCEKLKSAVMFLEKLNRDGITWTEFENLKSLELKVKSALINHIVERYLDYGLSKENVVFLMPLIGQLKDLLKLNQEREECLSSLVNKPEDKVLLSKLKKTNKEFEDSESKLSNNISLDNDKMVSFYLGTGNKAFADKEYTKAAIAFSFCIMLNPKEITAYESRAETYSRLRKYRKAAEDLLMALRIQPDSVYLHHQLANIYSDGGESQLALYEFAKIIELDQRTGLRWRAEYCANKDMLEDAIDDYSMLIVLEPENYWNYIYRGDVYRDALKSNLAIDDYTSAIGINDKMSTGYIHRAYVFGKLSNYKSALKDYSMAIKLDPLSSNYIHRANMYFRIEEYDLALKDATEAVKISPDNPKAYRMRASALKEMGDPITAAFDLETAENLEAKENNRM